ncbi:DUF397 domain-containing protein [Streptomyces sp. NPDC048290]|uniref:DUF397 domain-containing protein n=1 Tax=Streptomyces sp. NPDC048290 TaxID=3155811 RepID=UPI00344467AE
MHSTVTGMNWRKSSYSGEGDGNECVEVATTPTRTAVRDSKHVGHGALTFPRAAFAAFLQTFAESNRT